MGCRCSLDLLKQLDYFKEKDLSKANNCIMIDTSPINKSPQLGYYSSSGDNRKHSTFKQYCSSNKKLIDNNITSLTLSLFEEINQVRANPRSYIRKIAKYLSQIVTRNNKSFLQVNKNIFISLSTGLLAFEDTIAFLSTLKPMEPLHLCERLKIEIKEDNEECTSLNYIKNGLMNKREEINDEFTIVGFHYDKSVNNVEVSTVLQIVDDTGANSVRRNNILNRTATHIGISACRMKDNYYCFYLVFGNKK